MAKFISEQQELFHFNVTQDPAVHRPDILAWEAEWVAWLFECSSIHLPHLNSYNALKQAIEDAVHLDSSPSSDSSFIAQQMTRKQFGAMVLQYAPDGLTEAMAMFAILPRLEGTAQSAVMRILIDEFGCGNSTMVHSQLYRQLLTELNLPTCIADLPFAEINEESYAFVNIYHWLCKRAPVIDYYLGALAYTEMVIPASFRHYVTACDRLGITASQYFAEHVHIDEYHSLDALTALRSLVEQNRLNLGFAWKGAEVVRRIGAEAVKAAVQAARGIHDRI